MTDYARLTRNLHARLGDLVAVALALGWSKGTWSLIENGKRDPTRAQMNAIRAAVGMDLLPVEPVEIRLHDEPDAALLVNLDGKAPQSVSVRTSTGVLDTHVKPSVRVAVCNPPSKAKMRSSVVVKNALWKKLAGAKIRHGGTWDAFMLAMLEKWEE
jgi:transcriptional regulator with XRE-family HTH domain